MPGTELKDLRAMSAGELRELLEKNREELRAQRFRLRLGQEKKVRLIREKRVLIARVLTLLGENKLSSPSAVGKSAD